METEILYWHWLVLGMILAMAEIILTSFTALWFGLGAILVGIAVWLFPATPLWAQVLFWVVSSLLLTWLWFKFLKPLSVNRTMAGLSREQVVGEMGHVLSTPVGDARGAVRFSKPVLGADEWPIICNSDLSVGDRVRVADVIGNALLVEPT